jgi:D-alanine-D-alanine ligase
VRIAVVHNPISDDETDPSERDVLEQARYIHKALISAGHEAGCFPMDAFKRAVRRNRPDCVFNLVESLDGRNEMLDAGPAAWELLKLPYTGSGGKAMAETTNKAVAKEILRDAGIPTPEWAVYEGKGNVWKGVPAPWILKPLNEDASVGIEDSSVVREGGKLAPRVRGMRRRFRQPILIERFIEGREFNISIIGSAGGPRVLPAAEMIFRDFPPGKERIVGFRAKWETDTFEYKNTVRRFDYGPEDAALLRELRSITRRCWDLFNLHGYARVDYRVDGDNRPWVIEVNVNPCLSPDAGFMAAVRRARIAPKRMVKLILEDLAWQPPAAR